MGCPQKRYLLYGVSAIEVFAICGVRYRGICYMGCPL